MFSDSEHSFIIEEIRKGSETDFEIAYLKYYAPLGKYAWKYVRSEALAEEIVQEVFAALWEKRFDLDSAGHLRGLLHKMVRNKALDYIKHEKIVDRYQEKVKQARRSEFSINYSEKTDNIELVHDVQQAISDLPPKARQVFKLNRDEGLTYKEISNYLDISIKTVESQMRRVFQILRESLSKYSLIFIYIYIGLSI